MKNKIIAIIPCRSGSKEIKNKNIKKIFGKPLVYYSIFFALQCKFIDRVIVSTNSKRYKKICESLGAEVPFLRPKSISKDSSLDIDLFKHAINWLKKNENYESDLIVHLRPTSPLRRIKTLKKMTSILLKNKNLCSVRSLSILNKSPYKLWSIKNNNLINPILKNNTLYNEPYNAPRQKLPNFYVQNAAYDVFRTKIIKKNLISGKKIHGVLTEDLIDIDTIEDINKLKKFKLKFKFFKKYIFS
tara:strand:- start:567 stop:1298 length:732 start_codon:yes stop_codon:yes gene_type:complete